nr:MAG TPA: hypothetical protein [Caudoviricetes sp.]
MREGGEGANLRAISTPAVYVNDGIFYTSQQNQ